MNSAINSLLALASLGLKVPIKPKHQTDSGFGSVLQSAIGTEPPIPSDISAITEGRMSVIKDLLVFLNLKGYVKQGKRELPKPLL
ncbi:hypothetical protein ACFX4I_03675 [Peribacillus sp. YIM B13472]|uniref:hypothetical protein n=1 Tax=Peribacillus sp. YIM B13472 TaxID=3366297 RepID=UPI00366D0671